jgi:hypothetical protein
MRVEQSTKTAVADVLRINLSLLAHKLNQLPFLALALLWINRSLHDLINLSLGIIFIAILITLSLLFDQLGQLVNDRVFLLELEMKFSHLLLNIIHEGALFFALLLLFFVGAALSFLVYQDVVLVDVVYLFLKHVL